MVSVVNKNAKELFDYCKHAPKYFRGCLPYAKKFNHLVYNIIPYRRRCSDVK